ncbi:MAG TPA: Ig-like domain-containing protein, partial [Candidatus Syntrophosphaera thermopropionivorans]|nr:Ig-like domain-containing protein [Candidatus Syntrophosphaera thermopropionivorans]
FTEAIKGYGSIKINRLDNKEESPVLLSYLEEDKLTLLTASQDAFAYTLELYGVEDKKGNVSPVIKSEFRSSIIMDTEPPQVVYSSPRNGTSVKSLEPILEVCFSEVIPRASIKASLRASETKTEIPIEVLQSDSRIYRFKPQKPLQNYRSYVLTISATDISGNSMPESFNLNFLPLIYQD